MKGDIDAMADQVFQAVKAFIALSVGKVSSRVDLIDQTVKAIPAPLKGDPGEKGLPGESIKGDRGERGEKGEPGESIKGDKGDKGDPGESIRGEKGEPGESIKGDPGESIRGEKGEPGESVKGDRGDDGESIKGDTGEPGQSAYQLALAKGYDGTERQWLASLRGEKGDTGLAGKDGSAGINGKDGLNGLAGKDGASAFEIAKGHGFSGSEFDWVESLRGKQGPPGIGKDGRDGRETVDGRDALELDVLDGIDETRSYPRSTYASFNGGTFRAARATDPLKGKEPLAAGWQCVFRGVGTVTEEWQDGGRFVVKTITFCDGTKEASRHQTAMPVYRGAYQAGRKYLAGDMMTFRGSQWTAKQETTARPREDGEIGEDKNWQLSIKAEIRSPR